MGNYPGMYIGKLMFFNPAFQGCNHRDKFDGWFAEGEQEGEECRAGEGAGDYIGWVMDSCCDAACAKCDQQSQCAGADPFAGEEKARSKCARNGEVVGIEARIRSVRNKRMDVKRQKRPGAVIEVADSNVYCQRGGCRGGAGHQRRSPAVGSAPAGEPGDDDQPEDCEQGGRRQESSKTGSRCRCGEEIVQRDDDRGIHGRTLSLGRLREVLGGS
jgi:hypothetical protein